MKLPMVELRLASSGVSPLRKQVYPNNASHITPQGCGVFDWIKCGGAIASCVASCAATGPACIPTCLASVAPTCIKCL